MQAVTDKTWWLESWHCEVCKTTIRKHHMARHFQSAMHKRLISAEYPSQQADRDFSAFLQKRFKFKGIELEKYNAYKGVSNNG